MSRTVTYTLRSTSLGLLLVAASERGVCQVRFGASRSALEAALARELPCAALVRGPSCAALPREPSCAALPRGEAHVERWADTLAAACEGRADAADVPLDVAGSRFQRRVWDALRRIPQGAQRGYGELAAELGQPRAARAVARACATNPAPLAVPCHRVVPKSGGVGGYRFGSWRKRALLAAEAEPRSS